MKNLSFIEFIALLFTGVAGIASAVQAFVSYETRGEVSRAIVFSERIDACAQLLSAIDPFLEKARPEFRAKIAEREGGGRYSLPGLFYGTSAGTPAFDAAHQPRVEAWSAAWATATIVLPDPALARGDVFDALIVRDIEAGTFMNQAELLTLLERIDAEAEGLAKDCRNLL
ncbi:MAG: hypothetical protein AAFV62_08975 [Pseudomonadota bacterium]